MVMKRTSLHAIPLGLDRSEQPILTFHQHWMRLVKPTFHALGWTILFCASPLIALLDLPLDDGERRILLMATAPLFLFAQFIFITQLYRYFLYIVVITESRVHRLKKTMLTIDEHESVDLRMLQDIERVQIGVIQNLFRYGTIVLEANIQLKIHYTPRIEQKYRLLIELRERTRMQHQPPPPIRETEGYVPTALPHGLQPATSW